MWCKEKQTDRNAIYLRDQLKSYSCMSFRVTTIVSYQGEKQILMLLREGKLKEAKKTRVMTSKSVDEVGMT